MNPYPYVKGFAWIAIVALSCSIFTSYWVPVVIGAVALTLLLRVALSSN